MHHNFCLKQVVRRQVQIKYGVSRRNLRIDSQSTQAHLASLLIDFNENATYRDLKASESFTKAKLHVLIA